MPTTISSLPPPPNLQSIAKVEVIGRDSTGKPIHLQVTSATDPTWQEWLWRLREAINTAPISSSSQTAIQFQDEGVNLGASGTADTFNVVGPDLVASRSTNTVTLTQSRPTITLSGDVSGSGTTSITTTLATVNSNIGTFAAATFNAKGLATSATNLSGDLTTSGSVATLATVNSNVGTFTALTVNGKGLTTAATNLSLTGDVTGTASGSSLSASVVKINGVPLGSTTATSGNLLIANGTSWVSNPTSGDVTIDSSGVMTIGANKVTNAKFRQSVPNSVVGRAGSGIGNVADIQATASGQVLRLDPTGILWSAIDLTNDGSVGFTGRLPALYGGTGLSAYAVGDLIYASAITPTLSRLAAVSAGSYLRSTGTNAAPAWSTVKIPNTASTGDLWYGSASNTISALAANSTATNKFLTQVSSGAPAWNTISSSDLPTITLTGDVTGAASSGSIATTVAKITGTTVSGTTGSTNVVFSSSPSITSPTISGGTINNNVIGGTTAVAGTFSALTANNSLSVSGTATITNTANTTLTTLASSNGSAGNAAVCRSQWGTSASATSFVIDVYGTNFTGKGSVVELNNTANSNMRFLTNNTIAMDINGSQVVTYYGNLVTSGSSLKLTGEGDGIYIKEGASAATLGVATLVAGTVTVTTTKVTANSRIFLSRKTIGGTPGTIDYTISAGASFTINSTSGTDTSVVNWFLLEPA